MYPKGNRLALRPAQEGNGGTNFSSADAERVDRQVTATTIHYFARGFRRMDSVRQFIHDEDGQDVVEYGLLIATIAIVVLIGVNFFGGAIQNWFQQLARRITTNA
jgi:Flp pilus assembly pilin Flp